MGKVTRKRYGGDFKAKVALEAIKGDLMRQIDAVFTEHPYFGTRQMMFHCAARDTWLGASGGRV